MERRFVLKEVDSEVTWLTDTITESELKRRLLILMDIEDCNDWPKAINILLHGEEKEQPVVSHKQFKAVRWAW